MKQGIQNLGFILLLLNSRWKLWSRGLFPTSAGAPGEALATVTHALNITSWITALYSTVYMRATSDVHSKLQLAQNAVTCMLLDQSQP